MSSAHLTFVDEAGAAECERRGWLIRTASSITGSTAAMRASKIPRPLVSRRAQAIRKERGGRARAAIRSLRGREIGPADWDAMWAFYQDTGRGSGAAYLTRDSSI
jgi:predicted N-acyltransferase